MPPDPISQLQEFTAEQRNYLQGFVAGADAARSIHGLPGLSAAVSRLASPAPGARVGAGATPLTIGATGDAPPSRQRAAQDRTLAAGGKLCNEENAKRDKNPFALWEEMEANAHKGKFPKGTDVFLYKYHGLFYVAPAQDSFMCRMRLPAGIISAAQLRGVADIAEHHAGGYAHVTTRANLQIREIPATEATHVLAGLIDLGIVTRGAGADNIRNVTASPTAGIDPQELIDTRPLARRMHHYILQTPEMYQLPRKFNIAFDGGGRISALAETNDIAFIAVKIAEGGPAGSPPPGVYFRMELGGITGHGDFSRQTGLLLTPDQCVPAAAAVVRLFIDHGDRTDRRKARLKYLLDRWGHEKFIDETCKLLPFSPLKCSADLAEPPQPDPQAHIGVHPQKQPGMNYLGVALPVGRLTCPQMRGLADIADRYGSRSMRLTVWQNLLIPDLPDSCLPAAIADLQALGLSATVSPVRAGLVACTGNTGCKFAASDTKSHAMLIAEHVEARLQLDQPLNIHLTGCHHSCAQHYIGDIGLLATKVADGEEMLEGYHLHLGGGHGANRRIAREYRRDIPVHQVPAAVETLLRAYLRHRSHPAETFQQFTHRNTLEEIQRMATEFEHAVSA